MPLHPTVGIFEGTHHSARDFISSGLQNSDFNSTEIVSDSEMGGGGFNWRMVRCWVLRLFIHCHRLAALLCKLCRLPTHIVAPLRAGGALLQ